MNYIYFATSDFNIIDNVELSKIAMIVHGKEYCDDDFESIREYAKICKGILKEIDNPSVSYLVKHGHKINAIRLLHRLRPELRLTEVKEFVDKMEKEE